METKISSLKIVWLHLFPGILITAIYVLITPFVQKAGFPSLMGLAISFLLVILPFELGYLFIQAKKNGNGKLSSILMAVTLPKKKFISLIFVGIFICIIIATGSSYIDNLIKNSFFQWLPDWYFYDTEFSKGYTKQALLITAIVRLFVDGIIIPYTEEIYFRGYLLPKIKGNKTSIPIIATVLFSLYHFWQPWNYPTLLIISGILVFSAWRFKNYKISLYIHLTINLLGSILFLLMVNR
jgi:uncharacterized protein